MYENIGLFGRVLKTTGAATNTTSPVSVANAISPVITEIVTSFVSPFYNIGSSSYAIYDVDSSVGNDPSTTVTLRTYNIVYMLYFDTTFDTALDTIFNTAFSTTFTSVLHTSPSYDIDTESSTVSIANEATSTVTKTPTVSYHSLNYFFLILPFESSCQFNQVTMVFLQLLSLHRTLHLIITSLLLLISNPYFDTISC